MGRVVTRSCGHVEELDPRSGHILEEAAAKLCLACWTATYNREQDEKESEQRVVEAGQRATVYMLDRFGPVPQGEALADKWHEKLGLLIDFQVFWRGKEEA